MLFITTGRDLHQLDVFSYLSESSAGLAFCKGRSAVQKSSTVNFPSFLSAPYTAMTLPKKDNKKHLHQTDTSTAHVMLTS